MRITSLMMSKTNIIGPDTPFIYSAKSKSITTQGYYKINDIDKRDKTEHWIVFEEYHQCCLLPWANIHHKNGIKTDNRPENLEGMTNSQHSKLHHPYKDKSSFKCKDCNCTYTHRYYKDNTQCHNCYKKERRIKNHARSIDNE